MKIKYKMTFDFPDSDRNGNDRNLIAHFKFQPEEEETNYGAQVTINRIELHYKGMKRRDVSKYISHDDIEFMNEKILESITE